MKKLLLTISMLFCLLLSGITEGYAQNAMGIKAGTSRRSEIRILEENQQPFNSNTQTETKASETNIKTNQAKELLLDEGFEDGLDQWDLYNLGDWNPAFAVTSYFPHSGEKNLVHNYYGVNCNDWVVSHEIYLDQDYILEFWDLVRTSSYYDYSGVLISTGSGNPESGDFIEIYNAAGAVDFEWNQHIYDLSDYTGETIYIAFQYMGSNAHGYHLDDIRIIPPDFTDGALTAITNPAVGTTTSGGSVEDVTIQLTNFGTTTIEEVEIEWEVNGVDQTLFQSTDLDLAPEENIELIVGQFDFSEDGEYIISATCTVSEDLNPGNNSITGTYNVDDLGDAGIIAIQPQGNEGLGGFFDVIVKIKNYGNYSLESVNVKWSVNGETQATHTADNLGLLPGQSIYDTITQFDFTTPQLYEIIAATDVSADINPHNDTANVVFAPGVLFESFEGHPDLEFPPHHWIAENATPQADLGRQYHGYFGGMMLSGVGEFGEAVGYLKTPPLDIKEGDSISFYALLPIGPGGGLSVHWLNEETGELNHLYNVSQNLGEWNKITLDISAAAGINRIVFRVLSGGYSEGIVDYITSNATIHLHDHDLELGRFTHNPTPLADVEDTLSCSVKNYSPSAIGTSSYTIRLMEEPGVELASQSGQALNPMEETEYNFYHTFTDNNQHNLYFEIDYPEDTDQADNISDTIAVYPVPSQTSFVDIGDGTMPNLNIPFTTFGTDGWGDKDISQVIYHYDEIGSMGYIHGVSLHLDVYGMGYGQNIPLKVWVGETENTNLNDGWEPFENLTPVFDSVLVSQIYEYEMYIPFDEPYLYGGNNLVIQFLKYDPSFPCSWHNWTCTEVSEMRTIMSPHWYEIDPANPPSGVENVQQWVQIPNVTFAIDAFADLTDISGTVTDENNNPIEGAMVELDGSAIKDFTDDEGNYNLPPVPFGERTIKASALGFEDNLQTINIEEDNITLDFNMIAKPVVTISGYIEGTGNPGEPLEGVSIEITGYNTYEETSSVDGTFAIEVFGNAEYTINVSKFGYESYSTSMSITNENLDLGTIILQERIISTYNVSALENPDDIAAEIYWHDPATGMEDTLMFDYGVESYGLANGPNENVWLGNFIPNTEEITITSVTLYFINNPQGTGWVTIDIFDEKQNLLVSSEPFQTQNDTYITVDMPNLTYDGNLFIMLHWKGNPSTTHMLGTDFTTGISDLLYIGYPGEDFQLVSGYLGIYPGCALIRANVLKEGGNKGTHEGRAVQSYNIYRGLSHDLYNMENWTQMNNSPLIDLEYIDESWNETEPNDYRYAVEAIYAEGTSDVTFSNALSIPFFTPTNLQIFSDLVSGDIVFEWESPEHNVQSFNVYLDDLQNPLATGVTDLSYILTDLLSSGMHEIGVQANYNSGASEIETIEFVFTGLDDLDNKNTNIYPNPAKDFIHIQNASGAVLSISDLSGKVLIQKHCIDSIERIDVTKLPVGTYLVKIINGDQVTTHKINVIK